MLLLDAFIREAIVADCACEAQRMVFVTGSNASKFCVSDEFGYAVNAHITNPEPHTLQSKQWRLRPRWTVQGVQNQVPSTKNVTWAKGGSCRF